MKISRKPLHYRIRADIEPDGNIITQRVASVDTENDAYISISLIKNFIAGQTVCFVDWLSVPERNYKKGFGTNLLLSAISFIQEYAIENDLQKPVRFEYEDSTLPSKFFIRRFKKNNPEIPMSWEDSLVNPGTTVAVCFIGKDGIEVPYADLW